MGRRIVLLVVAIAIAAVGAAFVFVYVKGADDRALRGQQPVEVLVAKTQISAGTPVAEAASRGDFVTKRVPVSAVAVGALSTIEPIRESVALAPIYPGQQILTPMFGKTASETAASSLPLPEGDLAVSFQFGDPARVAGFVQPGSKVAVFVTASPKSSDSGKQLPDFTRVLLPSASVIAVGPTTLVAPTDPKQANTEAVPKALLTLALDQNQAAKLVFASQHGQLYLGLLNDKSKVTAGTVVTADNLFR